MKKEEINKQIQESLTTFALDIDASKVKEKLNDIEEQLDRIISKYEKVQNYSILND